MSDTMKLFGNDVVIDKNMKDDVLYINNKTVELLNKLKDYEQRIQTLEADAETARMLDLLIEYAKDTYQGYGHVAIQQAGDGLFYAWILDEDERVKHRVDGLESRPAAIRALHAKLGER